MSTTESDTNQLISEMAQMCRLDSLLRTEIALFAVKEGSACTMIKIAFWIIFSWRNKTGGINRNMYANIPKIMRLQLI